MIDIPRALLTSPRSRETTKAEKDARQQAKTAAAQPIFAQRAARGLFGPGQDKPAAIAPGGTTNFVDMLTMKPNAQDAAKADMQRRFDALSPAVQAYKGDLPRFGREALDMIHRRCLAAGGEPIAIHRATLGDALGVTPVDAERLLDNLERVGAVSVTRSLGLPARYRPNLDH